MRPSQGFWSVVVANAVLGVPAYFISFLFAYGFEDVIGPAQHATLLILIAVFATVAGLVGMALPMTPPHGAPARRRAAFGVWLSLALNSVVVGVGSIISATHKEENSVSAGFSTTTDMLVAGGLFVTALAFAAVALRTDLSAQPVVVHDS